MISRSVFRLCKSRHITACLENISVRTLSSSARSLKETSEVEIPVPWGKVTGKLWGPKDAQPILAIHGWQDNAGTYDELIPLLPSNTSVLAIDLPGHGRSSWLPKGAMYNEVVYLLLIQRLKRHFGWEKVKIMAHSLGAQMSFWHTSMFPEQTQFVIAIDALKFPSIDVQHYSKAFNKAIETLFKIEGLETPPIRYTKDEIIERWKATAVSFVDDHICETLMVRGTTKGEDGKYVFNRDPRLKILPIQSSFTHDHLMQQAQLITCPYLFIKAKESSFFEKKENIFATIDTMRQKNSHVYFETLVGSHHFHISHAKDVANTINPFLEKYNV